MSIIWQLIDRAQHKAELKTELLRVFTRGQQTIFFGKPVHQSIKEAILGNYVNVVEYLLGQQSNEAYFQHRNSRSKNVLHLASRLCNPALFRLLVLRFKNGMSQTDYRKETVLLRIIQHSSASRNRYKSALRYDDDGQMVLKAKTSEKEQKIFGILQLLRAYADIGSTLSPGHYPRSKS